MGFGVVLFASAGATSTSGFVLNDERYAGVLVVAGPNFGTGVLAGHVVW